MNHPDVERPTDEPIMAGMATVPSREDALGDAIHSLLHQVDVLGLYVAPGDWERVRTIEDAQHPCEIRTHYVEEAEHDDHGDAGKFWWAEEWDGYYLTVDDDIIYPPTYVADTIEAIDTVGPRAAVSCHGVILGEMPLDSYYRNRSVFHWQREVRAFHQVHLACTGWAAFHTNHLDLSMEDFPEPQMADIWFGIECQRAELPAYVRPHPPSVNQIGPEDGYLTQNPKVDLSGSIYANHHRRDGLQTDTVNEFERTHGWQLPTST